MDPDNQPPRFAIRFLAWFCPEALYESIEGDLLEQFACDRSAHGLTTAKKNFVWNVARFFRPGVIFRNKFSGPLIDIIMLHNYFIIAFRNLGKHKMFSGINILGLGVGLAACFLIFQFVTFELSYDKFNEKFDRIYRVTNNRYQNGKLIQHGTITYPTIGPAMARDYPEVEAYTRLMPAGVLITKAGDRVFRGEQAHFADAHFLSVFSYPLVVGQPLSALKETHTVVLTERTADKFFEGIEKDYQSVMGKVVYLGQDQQPYRITGICSDVPENSHLQFDVLISYTSLMSPEEHGADDSWTWSDMFQYLVLKPGTDPKELEGKFDAFSARYFKGDQVSGSVEKFFLQPLTKAHLYSNYEYDIAKTANGKAVWAMLVVAGFILCIAWINYINLTTSRALERAKEVGLRKVMGAIRSQLIKQFIFESIVVSFFAFLVAVLLVSISQSSFNEIIRGNLSWWKVFHTMDTSAILVLVAVMVAGILLSGFYPAFVLSAYQPVTVLKGKFVRSGRGNRLRKGLVVFQFMMSAVLITSTLIVSEQLKFMEDADLGINIQNTVIVEAPERMAWDSTFIDRVESYKAELSQRPGVISATTSNNIPGARLGRAFNVHLVEEGSASNYTMSFMGIDYSFFDVYGIDLLAGRPFLPTDHHVEWDDISNVVMNHKAIQLLGIGDPSEAVGKTVSFWDKTWTIVGVISDFHQQALQNPMEPMLFFPTYATHYPTSIRIQGAEPQKALAEVEQVFKKFFPDNAFEYFFLEDRYKNQYRDDVRFGKVVGIFTVLAIVIGCLGLVGLSAYTAVQRTKEIGIRKALGATRLSIVSLLSGEFIKLILLATLLSAPIAYMLMHNWLESYAYQAPLRWILFALPGLLILVIASLTLSFQIIRTANTNPADTLKYE